MRTMLLGRLGLVMAVLFALNYLGQSQVSNVVSPELQMEPGQTSVNVFFGAAKASSVEEIKTNALAALRSKGHQVPLSSKCVLNVKVQGAQPGCAVLFWDLPGKKTYQVVFSQSGDVTSVTGGPMRHNSPAPGDPVPKVPDGGVPGKETIIR